MSRTIWVLVEDGNDGAVFKALLEKKRIDVRVIVRKPNGGGGIGRLAAQVEEIIASINLYKSPDDCIIVLHDADEKTRADERQDYKHIAEICAKADRKVVHLIARDELESWLLADQALCKWLDEKPRNRDEEAKPSEILGRWLKKKNLRYQGTDRAKMLAHLDGTGDKHSPSMREAFQKLHDADCL